MPAYTHWTARFIPAGRVKHFGAGFASVSGVISAVERPAVAATASGIPIRI
jgi:hypothetical protein